MLLVVLISLGVSHAALAVLPGHTGLSLLPDEPSTLQQSVLHPASSHGAVQHLMSQGMPASSHGRLHRLLLDFDSSASLKAALRSNPSPGATSGRHHPGNLSGSAASSQQHESGLTSAGLTIAPLLIAEVLEPLTRWHNTRSLLQIDSIDSSMQRGPMAPQSAGAATPLIDRPPSAALVPSRAVQSLHEARPHILVMKVSLAMTEAS